MRTYDTLTTLKSQISHKPLTTAHIVHSKNFVSGLVEQFMNKYNKSCKRIQKVMEVVYSITKTKIYNPFQSINKTESSDRLFFQTCMEHDQKSQEKAEKIFEYSMNKAININKRENILKSVNSAFMLIGKFMSKKMNKGCRPDPWTQEHFPTSLNTKLVVENYELNFGANLQDLENSLIKDINDS